MDFPGTDELQVHSVCSQAMSDSDEFEYESDDDPYGGAEEEAFI